MLLIACSAVGLLLQLAAAVLLGFYSSIAMGESVKYVRSPDYQVDYLGLVVLKNTALDTTKLCLVDSDISGWSLIISVSIA